MGARKHPELEDHAGHVRRLADPVGGDRREVDLVDGQVRRSIAADVVDSPA